jgi:plastocyanin
VKKAATIFAAGALAAFGVAACGSSSNNDTTTAASTTASTPAAVSATVDITAAADGSFSFDQKTLTAKAGPTTIAFDNPASLSHDVVLTDSSGAEVGKTDLISQSNASFSADLKPGTYTYFCDVPGHRQGGMEGTLTVK